MCSEIQFAKFLNEFSSPLPCENRLYASSWKKKEKNLPVPVAIFPADSHLGHSKKRMVSHHQALKNMVFLI